MTTRSTFIKAIALLAAITLSVLLAACQPEGFASLSPLLTATSPTSPLPTPIATSGPTPTPYPTPWPQDFTPSPTATPTVTPEGIPFLITDPVNRLSLTLLPGWYASIPSKNAVAGATVIKNYFEGDVSSEALKIQISVHTPEAGQSFEEWLVDRRVRQTSPEYGAGGVTLTEPQPYTLGRYTGVTYIAHDSFSGEDIMIIYLLTNDERIVGIGLRPVDSLALSEGLSILSTLEVLSATIP